MISENWLAQLHFLRPDWLWMLLPVVLLFILLWRLQQHNSNWMKTISADLLPHLLDDGTEQKRHHLLIAVILAWLIAVIALAGPTWSKLPQPVHQREDALVILMDLSLSLYATDLKPSRLVYAQRKLTDILQSRQEGQTALIVYSGDAHVVSPLTDDTATIVSMVPALAPNIMPTYGSNATAAGKAALQLMKDAGVSQARILLITDELLEKDAKQLGRLFSSNSIAGKVDLAILGIGTKEGAPIPTREGGFLKDNNGGIVVAQLNAKTLRTLANNSGGRYAQSSIDDRDIKYLLPETMFEENTRQIEREFDIWQEQGHWLVLLLLPLVLLSFRRGWLLGLLIAFSIVPEQAHAFEWQDLWQNKDQRGEKAFKQGEHQKAAEVFKSNDWRASAQYRAGDYQGAAQSYALEDNAQSNYNRGNALAKAGEIDQAISAYERALELEPEMSDAIDNKTLLEQLKQQQQEQQQDQEGQNQENKDQQQGQDSDQSSKQEQDQSEEQQANADQSSNNNEQQQSEQDQQTQASEEEQRKKEQEQQAKQNEENPDDESKQQSLAQQTEQALDPEQQQALEQWLRRVPDDPGGLLRRKFDYQYRQNMQKNGLDNNSGQQIW